MGLCQPEAFEERFGNVRARGAFSEMIELQKFGNSALRVSLEKRVSTVEAGAGTMSMICIRIGSSSKRPVFSNRVATLPLATIWMEQEVSCNPQSARRCLKRLSRRFSPANPCENELNGRIATDFPAYRD